MITGNYRSSVHDIRVWVISSVVVTVLIAIWGTAFFIHPAWHHKQAMRFVQEAGGTVQFESTRSDWLAKKLFGMEATATVTAIVLRADLVDRGNSLNRRDGMKADGSPSTMSPNATGRYPISRDNARRILNDLETFNSLQTLDLTGLPLTDDDLVPLFEADHPTLRQVKLIGTQVSEDFVLAIQKAKPGLKVEWSKSTSRETSAVNLRQFNRPSVNPVIYFLRAWALAGTGVIALILFLLVVIKRLGVSL